MKQNFKIPTSLDVSYMDMEFNFKSKDGVGINKPLTAKVVLSVLFAVFAWFYLVFQTFIIKGGIGVIIGFTIFWFLLALLLLRTDNTGRMGLELVFSLLNYLPKSGRYVPVRLADSVYPLQSLLNVHTIDEEDGCIHFLDGQIGYVYHVVGSASALMFEQDKQVILSKVDAFYRKLPVGVEVIYDTVFEGHAVDDQIQNIEKTRKALRSKSPGLQRLLTEQHDILKHAINNHKALRSFHQYMVVRCPSESDLKEFENLVIGDVEGSGLMFRLAKTLNYEETQNYFKSILSR